MRNMRLKNKKATFFEAKFSALSPSRVDCAVGHGQVFHEEVVEVVDPVVE